MTVTDAMHAVVATKQGPLDDLIVSNKHPVPSAASGRGLPSELKPVLVKVEYAALQLADVFMCVGGYFVQEWPFVPGVDFAGTVAEAPSGSSYRVGDRVCGYTGCGHPASGTLAHFCSAPAATVARVPEGVSMSEASTFGCAVLTAAAAVWRHGGISEKNAMHNGGTRTVVVYGASSSVGMFAVQLAHLAGWRVVAVASKRHHAMLQSKLRADQAIDYHDADWMQQIASANPGGSVQVVLDCIGVEATASCFELLEVCGVPKGKVVSVHLRAAYPQDIQAKPESEFSTITEVADSYSEEGTALLGEWMRELSALLAAGKLVLNPVKVYEGFEHAKAALKAVEVRSLSGEKAVVRVT